VKRAAILVLAAILATIGFSLALRQQLGSAHGRELTRRGVEAAYARHLRGTLRIGSIDALEGTRARATDVRFFDPRGEVVVSVPEAEVDLDAAALFGGTLRFERARARDAVVYVRPGVVAKTSLEEAFASEDREIAEDTEDANDPSSPDRTRATERPLAIDTGAIRFDDTTLRLALGGPEVTLRELEGFVRVARSEGGPRVRLDAVRGRYDGPGARVLDHPRFEANGRLRVRPAGTEARFEAVLDVDPPWPITMSIDDGNVRIDAGEDGPPLVVAAMETASIFVNSLEVR
jgi:hypothetical protein